MTSTIKTKTHKINVTIETSDNITSDQLHELLCKAIHECDEQSIRTLMEDVVDIECGDPIE